MESVGKGGDGPRISSQVKPAHLSPSFHGYTELFPQTNLPETLVTHTQGHESTVNERWTKI